MDKKKIFLAVVIIMTVVLGAAFAQTGRVEPLLQTKWAQRTPFNNMMVNTVRHRTGCGTTAIAQIMKYYEHPRHGIEQSEPYSTGLGTIVPSVNFNFAYDWNNMLNTYNSGATQRQTDAVATLMYHLAVSFKINSGRTGTDSGTSTTRIMNALVTHFGYDKSIQRRNRKYFDDDTWVKIIREQLDLGMPVFCWYPGHFYVIDGYDDTGRFHFNWGWGGRSDGWYLPTVDWRTLGNEDADTGSEDEDGQNIVINIKPNAGGIPPGYEIALENFAAQRTTVARNERFEVYTFMRNVNNTSDRFYTGQAGVALVDNNNNIVAVIGTSNMGEGSWWSRLPDRPINCSVPNTVRPGQYRLKIVTRPTNGAWRFATLSLVREGVPNSINFMVQ